MKCNKCQIWEILPDDAFCSYCGERLIGFELTLDKEKIYKEDGKETEDNRLTIKNIGQSVVKIDDILTEPGYLEVMNKATHLVSLAQGEQREVDIRVKLKQLSDDPVRCRVSVKSQIGGSPQEEAQFFDILPKPELRLRLPQNEIFVLAGSEWRLDGFVEILKGKAVVRAEDIHVEGMEALIQIGDGSPVPLPSLEGPGVGGEVRGGLVELDANGVRSQPFSITINSAGLTASKDYTGTVYLSGIDTGKEVRSSFTVKVRLAPKLEITNARDGLFAETVFTGRERNVTLNLHNPGGIPFNLTGVEIKSSPEHVQCIITLPLMVDGNARREVTFKVNPKEIESGDSFDSLVRFITDPPDIAKEVILRFNVKEMPPYPHWVAFDFGTTNTCCAVATDVQYPGQAKMSILNPGGRDENIIPSVIYYRDIINDKPIYDVGQAVRDRIFDPTLRQSVVESIKSRLGHTEPIRVMINGSDYSFQPDEIAQHIIHFILRRVEDQLQHRITKCIITHPAKFFQIQLKSLRKIFIDYGLEEVNMISESTAAAFDYIIDKGKGTPEYTILVFDFGGGTIDITLLKVKEKDEKGVRHIYPETLDRDGKRFGGDDVTKRLANLIWEKCKDHYKEKNIPIEAPDNANQLFSQVASNNNKAIFYAAENAKIQLSNYREVIFGEKGSGDKGDVAVISEAAKGSKPSTMRSARRPATEEKTSVEAASQISFVAIELQSLPPGAEQAEPISASGFSISREELDELIEKDVDDSIRILKDLVNTYSAKPNVIVPVGLSCQIPLVQQKLKEAFPDVQIQYEPTKPNLLKECVARGAYLRYMLTSAPGKTMLHDEQIHLTTPTRFGILWEGDRKFKEIIAKRMLIPVKEHSIEYVVIGRSINITVAENAGDNDNVYIDDKRNEEIQIADKYSFKVPVNVPDSDLENAKINMSLTEDMKIRIITFVGTEKHEKEIDWRPIV